MKNILSIDTASASNIQVTLKKESDLYQKESTQKLGSQVLLNLITELLAENKLKFEDLTEIEVNTGPGSFTGLKVGVAVANALGFSLNVPVNGKKAEIDLKYV